jgi:monoamine oxidase
MDRHDKVEVAIVGGGVAGLYAAWRLAGAEGFPPKTIAIFEAGERLGGRLRSVRFAAANDLVAEVGGIAFHRTHHHVHRLVDQLGLPTEEHPIGSRRSLLNLRGRSLAYRRIRHQFVRPFSFRVARRTQIQGVAALLRAASERVLPGSASFTPDDWMRAARDSRFMGRALRDWPLRVALSQILEQEEVRFVEAASGFSLFTRAPNAATGLAWNMEELSVGGDLTRLVFRASP